MSGKRLCKCAGCYINWVRVPLARLTSQCNAEPHVLLYCENKGMQESTLLDGFFS